MGDVEALEISNFLDTNLFGKNIIINKVLSLNSIQNNSFTFSKSKTIDTIKECLILVPLDFQDNGYNFSYIKVANPRLSFAKIVQKFFVKKVNYFIDKSVKIGDNCSIDKNVKIAFNCVIGDNVSIGKGTILNNNIVIYDNTIIGNNCYIKSNSVIGEDGFGFDFEEDGTPIRIPHIGNVEIGNNVEIGANTSIARATIQSTIIEDNVKIDDNVLIAHNCIIGKNTIITACAEISGSVVIGKNCWIAPNCSIIQKITIGDNVTVGIGAIVTKNIQSNQKVMGLDSLELRPLLKLKKRIKYGE